MTTIQITIKEKLRREELQRLQRWSHDWNEFEPEHAGLITIDDETQTIIIRAQRGRPAHWLALVEMALGKRVVATVLEIGTEQ